MNENTFFKGNVWIGSESIKFEGFQVASNPVEPEKKKIQKQTFINKDHKLPLELFWNFTFF